MKITNKIIKEKNPCQDGYIWFLENFPNGCTYEELIQKIPSKWKDWVKSKFIMKEEYGDYLFKIDIGYGFEQKVFAFNDRIRFINKNNETSIDISLDGMRDFIEFIDQIEIIKDLNWQANTYLTHTIVTTCSDKGAYHGYILLTWQAQCDGLLHVKCAGDKYDEFNSGIVISLNSAIFEKALKDIIIKKERKKLFYK